MNDERDTARFIRAWMHEPAELDDRSLHAVLERLPTTPQRSHRWLRPIRWRPDVSGATRSPGGPRHATVGRNIDMMNATKMAAGVAVLALVGSLVFVAGPPGPAELRDPANQVEYEDARTVSTEAEAAPVAGTRSLGDMARFTYTSVMSAEYPEGRQFATDYGWAARDGRVEHTVDGSDDRIDGSAIFTYDSDYYDSDEVQYPVLVITGTEVLTNEQGTWEGPFELLDFPGTTDEHFTSVLRGTGEYAGLTAVLYGKDGKNEGVIFPGNLP